MNDNKIIDGKLISNQIREKIKFFGEKLIDKTGKKPGLAVVLVGENPAFEIDEQVAWVYVIYLTSLFKFYKYIYPFMSKCFFFLASASKSYWECKFQRSCN